jgi:tRNA pseudouridine synthase 10
MNIIEKTLEIYRQHYICLHCLGRMFSLLATNTYNLERGNSILLTLTMQNHESYLNNVENQGEIVNNLKILAQNARFVPAIKILEKEGIAYEKIENDSKCELCNDVFSNLSAYAEKARERLSNIEFDHFLVGSIPDPAIINKEDAFKAKYNLLGSESFKSHFNREVGKILNQILSKPTEFIIPDVTIIFNLKLDSIVIDFIIRSLFIYGRYNKYIRGIPQTHWDCRRCLGKGCPSCNYTGKQYQISVEELIGEPFLVQAQATDMKFHGAGREDIDVKMMGKGRPFILELKNPKIRSTDLKAIERKVNRKHKKSIRIRDLRFSNKNEVKNLKSHAENTKKTYKAIVTSAKKFKKSEFETLEQKAREYLNGKRISQRTPNRVSHRRADLNRQKMIYEIKGRYLKHDVFEFIIRSQGGTYIKELINGDEGRTKPSLSEVFDTNLACKKLDVIDIES